MLWPAQGTSVSKGTVYDEHMENMRICVQAHTVHAHRALPALQRWDHTRDPARTPRVTRPREPALHSCQQPLLFFLYLSAFPGTLHGSFYEPARRKQLDGSTHFVQVPK